MMFATRKHVQRCVDRLLLHAEQAPLLHLRVAVLANRAQQLRRLVHCVLLKRRQSRSLVRDRLLQRRDAALGVRSRARPRVERDTEGSANLDDLVVEGRRLPSLEVNDENGLVKVSARLGVRQLLRNILKVHKRITATSPEDRPRKALLLFPRDNAANVPKLHSILNPVRKERICQTRRNWPVRVDSRSQGRPSGLHDVLLLDGCGYLVRERLVVVAETHVLRIHFFDLILERIQGIRVIGEKIVHTIPHNIHPRKLAELVHQETEHSLQVLNTLNVLLVRAVQVMCIHVQELDVRLMSNQINVEPCGIRWQNHRTMPHCFRSQKPHDMRDLIQSPRRIEKYRAFL